MSELQSENVFRAPVQAEIMDGSSVMALVPVSQAVNRVHQLPSESLLSEYQGLLRRRKSLIAWLTIAGTLIGFLVTLTTLPVYRARTSLDIQNLNADFMNMKDVATTGGNDSNSTESYVQTQIKLLQSDTLRARTMKRMMHAAYPAMLQRDDLLSVLKSAVHLPGNNSLSKASLVKNAAKNVVVKPLGVTRLVEVTCDSWNAKFSAEFCNALTSEFSEQDREVRWNEAQKTSEWLSRQLADVRDNLSQSEKKLETATGADAMVLRHGGDSVAAEKLDELQTELMKAQADRVAKQAQFSTSTSASATSLPTVLDDGELRDYQAKLTDLRRQVAALVPPLTEENPKVQHLRSQITEMESTIGSKKQDLIDRIKNEYNQARQRESLLSAAYAAQEKKVAGEQTRDAQVAMLRHEVDSEQQLYQTLSQKVKEAGLASALQASTVRVVDAAQVPEQPIAPRRTISTLVGMLLGLCVGIAGAFIKERTETVLRAPGDASRYLSLRELGVIPSAKRTGREFPSVRVKASFPTRLLNSLGSPADNGEHAQSIEVGMWGDHASLVTEAFRSATYSILLAGRQSDRANVYVITSPKMGEGKTTVTCNLGFALAQANRRVLLIDGDLRKPRLHKVMNVPNEIGFRDLLRGDFDMEASPLSAYCRPTVLPNLSVIPSGSGSEEPVGLLHSPRCREVLNFLATQFDIILVDTPPVLHMADARILGGMATGSMLVFRARVTDREAAANARDLFINDRVSIIGTILNDFDPGKEGKTSYYGSYYSYRQESRGASLAAGKGSL